MSHLKYCYIFSSLRWHLHREKKSSFWKWNCLFATLNSDTEQKPVLSQWQKQRCVLLSYISCWLASVRCNRHASWCLNSSISIHLHNFLHYLDTQSLFFHGCRGLRKVLSMLSIQTESKTIKGSLWQMQVSWIDLNANVLLGYYRDDVFLAKARRNAMPVCLTCMYL